METASTFAQLLVSILTLATLVWGLLKMFKSAREAAAARVETKQAAEKAAYHAATTAEVVVAMAENIQKIEGIRDGGRGARQGG